MKPALYAAYVSGVGGSNIVLFYVSDTMIGGIDAGTGRYRGRGERLANGGLRGTVTLTVPAGIPLITGTAPLEKPMDVPITFDLPPGFENGDSTVAVTTALGTVNARFEKVMELD